MFSTDLPLLMDIVLWLIVAAFVGDAARRMPLSGQSARRCWVWLICTLALFAAQFMRVPLGELGTLQFLGTAVLAVVLGYCQALLSLVAVMFLVQGAGVAAHDVLLQAVMPVWLMHRLVQWIALHLPPNPFVFLLGSGFLGLFAVYSVQILASVLLHVGMSPDGASASLELLAYQLLLAAGEATLEGMLVTVLVVYLPGAVMLFDERRYVEGSALKDH